MSGATFAIEAEARVVGLLATVCDQSFGLAGGSPSAQRVFGAGVHFPCQSETSDAQLSDVTTWQDGYNGDAVYAEAPFAPGDGWHTYRFELRHDRLRLIVDGESLIDSPLSPPLDAATTDAETGIWSQGVGIEVRRIAVYPLPAH
jgi:hypothetical protein